MLTIPYANLLRRRRCKTGVKILAWSLHFNQFIHMSSKRQPVKNRLSNVASITKVPYYPEHKRYEVRFKKDYCKKDEPVRKYFSNLGQARTAVEDRDREKSAFGEDGLNQLSTKERADATEALKILGGTDFESLTDAMRHLRNLRKNEEGKSPMTISEIIEEKIANIEEKNSRDAEGGSVRTLQEYHYRGRKVLGETFGSMRVADFDNDKHFKPLWEKEGKSDHFLRICKSIFNHCIKNYKGKIIKECPITEKKFKRKRKRKEGPDIFKPDEWRRLILSAIATEDEEYCKGNTYQFTAWAVLGLWCGLRPDSELRHLDWKDVDLERKRIWVWSHKTHKGRWVEIPDCAVGVLKKVERKSGLVVKGRNYHKRVQDLKARAGVGKPVWKSDIMRHTFASMHWAKYQDERKLISLLGHKDYEMLDHYRRFEKDLRDQAEEFWHFTPPSDSPKGTTHELKIA